ncbi:hypothetical protein T4C_2010 [Trichinella pseudospiralis]|uniref:Uncharacterized protein n=1 Tax=Trichinella pseudospiralis TaxID=6337 RepID=A0A0V1KFP5_TRIPS|nr:hypothetical protein T4C_2010 [Trichinella pseudospiralis]
MFIFVFLSPINHHNHHIVRVCFPFIVLSSANQCILCLWLQLKSFVCFLFSSATLVRAALIRRCCTASSLTSVKHLLQLLLDFRPLWHGRPAGLPLAGRPVARLCCPPTGKFLQCSNAVATLAKLLARWRILHGRVAVLYFLPQPTSNYH